MLKKSVSIKRKLALSIYEHSSPKFIIDEHIKIKLERGHDCQTNCLVSVVQNDNTFTSSVTLAIVYQITKIDLRAMSVQNLRLADDRSQLDEHRNTG